MGHRTPGSIRLFVAAPAPIDTARRLLARLRDLDPPNHRPTPPEQVHLTLHFIGDRPKNELDDVAESITRAAAGLRAFDVTPDRLISLPRRNRPRLIAASLDAPPAVRELHDRLVRRLAREPRAKPSDRFTPHMTLCRFPRDHPAPPVDDPLDEPSFTIDAVRLYRSTLTPDGARHHELLAVPLGPSKPKRKAGPID